MNAKKLWVGTLVVLVLAALALPAAAQGEKIKVSVENAALRVKPDMDSEILEENIPLGTIFDVQKKVGEWFEVKYQSKLGVLITGYIHEMYVEVIPGEEGVVPVEPAPVEAPPQPAVRHPAPSYSLGGPKVEVGLGFGMGFGSFVTETSSYSYNWGPFYVLQTVNETGNLSHTLKSPMGLGFSLAYYFGQGLGVKVRVDMNFKQDFGDDSVSDYLLTWSWFSGGPYSRDNSWPITGDMSILPISLDIVYKFQTEGSFQPYVNAGVSIFTGKLNASTYTGWSASLVSGPIQYIDYAAVPLEITDESLSSVGANFGLGVDIFFSPSIAFNLDAAYFLGKSFDLQWMPVPGNYQGILGNFNFNNLTADALIDITDNITPLTVKTSFFKVMAGFKVGF
jgi:opacity protein-like surface antigen